MCLFWIYLVLIHVHEWVTNNWMGIVFKLHASSYLVYMNGHGFHAEGIHEWGGQGQGFKLQRYHCSQFYLKVSHSEYLLKFFFPRNMKIKESYPESWLSLILKSRLLNAKFLNSRQIKGVSPDILTRSFVPLWLCLIPKSRLLSAKILNSCKIKGLTQSQHPETR